MSGAQFFVLIGTIYFVGLLAAEKRVQFLRCWAWIFTLLGMALFVFSPERF